MVAVPTSHRTAQGTPLKSARERMDIIAAYHQVGSYRGAAEMCGTTPKTVKRVIQRHRAGGQPPERKPRERNYDRVVELVGSRVQATKGRISAKRLLPAARAAGYGGSARNFRRLVAAEKRAWRATYHRGRRPAVWAPGEVLVIDWGSEGGLHLFCAVLAWSRFRFVRFATDERAETTFGLLAECLDELGGVPGVVLADRMACLKGGVVANQVVPTPAYVRLATHYGFRPDFCEAADPESKGVVEHLVVERDLLGPLPSLRLRLGTVTTRKVDRLSCVRFGSARYSVPTRLIGHTVELRNSGGRLLVVEAPTGEIVADHALVAPGEASVADEHYGGPRPAPRRAVRPKTLA